MILPFWIISILNALNVVPVSTRTTQPNAVVVQSGGDWVYAEYTGGRGISSIGVGEGVWATTNGTDASAQEENLNQGNTQAGGPLGEAKNVDIFHNN